MILVCPQCETSFALPDEMFRPGRKARCSQCSFVFAMQDPSETPAGAPEETPPAETAPGETSGAQTGDDGTASKKADEKLPENSKAKTKGKSSKLGLVIILLAGLVCLAGLGYGGYAVYKLVAAKTGAVGESAEQKAAREAEEAFERVSMLKLDALDQFIIDNENMGRLVVVQGKVINNFDTPRDLIWVEAKLYDKNGKVLETRKQVCGIVLTLTQLRALNAQEIEQALNNKIDVLTNNMNIPSKGSTPFMVVFPRLPEGMYEYEVRPVEARESARPGAGEGGKP